MPVNKIILAALLMLFGTYSFAYTESKVIFSEEALEECSQFKTDSESLNCLLSLDNNSDSSPKSEQIEAYIANALKAGKISVEQAVFLQLLIELKY